MLWKDDVAELLAQVDKDGAVSCVKHDHRPAETVKMDGVLQTVYARKNWSSLMVMNPSKCTSLTPYVVNNQTGSWLHSMCWADEISGLHESWNWLEGWSSQELAPRVIHYTRGTPDMDPNVDKAAPWWDAAAKLGESNG